jgi:hypothetical protein
MSSTTGRVWQIGTYEGTTPAGLGGKIVSCTGPEKHASNRFDPNTGSRKADLNTTGIYWTIGFRLKVQKLAPFINSKCFVTAEGVLPSFNLYTFDGITKTGWTDCLVDTCDLSIDQEGYLIADVVVVSRGSEVKDLTIPVDSESPMSKSAVTAFSIGGTAISKWVTLKFGVKNNVQQVASGNGAAITDIYAKYAEYNLDVQIIKTGAPQYAVDSTTKSKAVSVTLTDNQAEPVSVTYTWANMDVSSNSSSIEELNLTYERISAVSNGLVIS